MLRSQLEDAERRGQADDWRARAAEVQRDEYRDTLRRILGELLNLRGITPPSPSLRSEDGM